MTIDPILDEGYTTFLIEAQDILRRMEQDLLSLKDDRSPEKVHRLMRSAHTLKGAAASVELDAVKQVAHVMEDIFRALYNPNLVIDAEVETILFEGYECLRLSLMTELVEGQLDQQDVLNRTAAIVTKLQEKLGDDFDLEAPLPTSVELGFDMVQSMFEVVVPQRLQELEQVIHHGDPNAIASEVSAKADFFLGLAESLDLPGFGAIAQTALAALTAHPDQIQTIAQLALEDFFQARTLVLAGDRTLGGTPSAALQDLAELLSTDIQTEIQTDIQVDIETDIGADIKTELTDISGVDIDISGIDIETTSLDDLFGDVNPTWDAPTQRTDHLNETIASDEQSRSNTTRPSVSLDLAESWRDEPVRVDIDQIKHLDYLAGELLINQNKQVNQDQQLRSSMEELRSSLRQHQQTLYQLQDAIERLLGQIEYEKIGQSVTPIPSPIPSPIASTIEPHSAWTWVANNSFPVTFDALEMERYSHLRLLMRSALNETAQLDQMTEDVDQLTKQASRTLETQKRVLRQVHDDLTTVRMQPLGSLLNRFPRLLQQLAVAHHKQVELTLSGTHVLVDKAIAEKLYDPILHLIRNAFDHGIEPPDIRLAQGKPEVGRIAIRANQQGNQTVIEVEDDGRGINLQRVAQRAIELNLMTAEQINAIPESQLLDFLFQPGFSTAAQVSDLSGRGIGLDVVNNQLKTMNGSVAVSTTPQQGTTFTLKIPLSLTTTKLLICQAEGFAYALPIERIEQILVPSSNQLKILGGEQLAMQWHHQKEDILVPLYSLSELVQYTKAGIHLRSQNFTNSSLTSSQPVNSDRSQTSAVLLLKTTYGYRGLKVDKILGEQELVVRAIGKTIAPPSYIYGCCVLSNSHLALAIDVEVLMQLTTEVESLSNYALPSGLSARSKFALSPSSVGSLSTGRMSQPGHLLKPDRSKTILIVDDSLTLRHNLSRLLKEAGYSVHQAGDGLEALAQLRQQSNVDLILCDIEMPRLNGFEFLNQIAQNPALAKIPVVVLTSRSSAKHRQIALALGAVTYLTKPYEPNELLAAIEQLVQPSLL